jgi:hypothetical protein
MLYERNFYLNNVQRSVTVLHYYQSSFRYFSNEVINEDTNWVFHYLEFLFSD